MRINLPYGFIPCATALCLATSGVARANSQDAATALLVESQPLRVVEGNSGHTPAVFTVKLKAPTGNDTVDYEVVAYTATPAEDYVPLSAGTLRFAAGETTKTVTVQVVGDTMPECDEGFALKLTHWYRGAPLFVPAVIVNDDSVADAGACPDPLTPPRAPTPSSPDAGAPDAGMPDAGAGSDARPGTPAGNGGGCAVAGSAAGAWPLPLFVLATWWGARGRRGGRPISCRARCAPARGRE
jgi:hypothetical protein